MIEQRWRWHRTFAASCPAAAGVALHLMQRRPGNEISVVSFALTEADLHGLHCRQGNLYGHPIHYDDLYAQPIHQPVSGVPYASQQS